MHAARVMLGSYSKRRATVCNLRVQNMKLTKIEETANEHHFLTMMTLGKPYIWKDYGHVYDMSSGKIVPQTWQGWFQLSKVVSEEFMKLFVEIDCLDAFYQAVKLGAVEAVKKEDRTTMQLCGALMSKTLEVKKSTTDGITAKHVFDFVRHNEKMWNSNGPAASSEIMQNPEIWTSWMASRGSNRFKSIVQALKEAEEAEKVAKKEVKLAEEAAKKEAKKADKKAKLLAANAAAMERDREAKEAIKKKSMDHPVPVSTTKITPEQIAAAEIREKERLKQLELEDKAAKKALRELKNKTKGKKVKHC